MSTITLAMGRIAPYTRALAKIRSMHRPHGRVHRRRGECRECGRAWPCPTFTTADEALEGGDSHATS